MDRRPCHAQRLCLPRAPAAPSDEAALAEFFTHVDKQDLRFRFLSAIQKVGHDQLQALVTVDHQRTENFSRSNRPPASSSLPRCSPPTRR